MTTTRAITTSLMALICAAAIPSMALAKPADSEDCRKAGGKQDLFCRKAGKDQQDLICRKAGKDQQEAKPSNKDGGTENVRKAGKDQQEALPTGNVNEGSNQMRKAGGDGVADLLGKFLNRDQGNGIDVNQVAPLTNGSKTENRQTNDRGDGVADLFGKYLNRDEGDALAVNQIAPLTKDEQNVRVIKDIETNGDGVADLITETDGMDKDVVVSNEVPTLENGKMRPINPTLQVADKLNGIPVNLPKVITPASNPVPQVTPNVVDTTITTRPTAPVIIIRGGRS